MSPEVLLLWTINIELKETVANSRRAFEALTPIEATRNPQAQALLEGAQGVCEEATPEVFRLVVNVET